MRGSISLALNCTGRVPPGACSLTLVCQTSCVTVEVSNAVPKPGMARATLGGLLDRNHAGSSVVSETPPSPSKLSTHACPAAFGCGRLVASSAWMAMRESPGRSPKGSRDSADESSGASKLQLPATPATSDDAGSKPSGGRLYCVFCDCEIAVKVSSPWGEGKLAARPKTLVGAEAKTGFSSYCTVTVRARGNSVSGRVKVTRPSS